MSIAAELNEIRCMYNHEVSACIGLISYVIKISIEKIQNTFNAYQEIKQK